MATKIITKTDVDTIAVLYQGGKSSPKIGKLYGLTTLTVLKILRDNGIHIRTQIETVHLAGNFLLEDLTKEVQAKICESYSSGILVDKIMEQFKISCNTLIMVTDSNNIPRRAKKRKLFEQFTKEEKAIVWKMYEDGVSSKEIEDKFTIENKTLMAIIDSSPIQRRRKKRVSIEYAPEETASKEEPKQTEKTVVLIHKAKTEEELEILGDINELNKWKAALQAKLNALITKRVEKDQEVQRKIAEGTKAIADEGKRRTEIKKLEFDAKEAERRSARINERLEILKNEYIKKT